MAEEGWNGDGFSTDLNLKLAAILDGRPDAAALAMAVAAAAEAAEATCRGRDMACAAGCPHCCVLNVSILLPEAMVITSWMREHLEPAEVEALQTRLAEHRSRIRWMDDEERIAKGISCPMLGEKGDCTIHPVRPLVCRAVASLDSGNCREAFAPVITDEARLVLTDLLRQAVFDVTFWSLGDVLRSCGFDDRSIELGAGLLAFLDRPELREEFLRGEKLDRGLWQ